MKPLMNLLLFATLFFVSCNTESCNMDKKEDSVAEKENEKKFEDTKMESEAEFITEVVDENMLIIRIGELAQTNAALPAVKELATTSIRDHTKANDELKAIAGKYNISVPTTLSDDSQKRYNDLVGKKGADFDKAYLSTLEDRNEEIIDEFQKQSDRGDVSELKTWATVMLPTLKNHEKMIDSTRNLVR